MSDVEESIPLPRITLKYERLHKILTLDQRNFKPCHPKVEEEWSWKKAKNVKFLVHFKKTGKWNIKRLSP